VAGEAVSRPSARANRIGQPAPQGPRCAFAWERSDAARTARDEEYGKRRMPAGGILR
jgi:hypothetical protein